MGDRKFTIYVLRHPITEEIRYIGYTSKTLKNRLDYHYYDLTKKINSHKVNWLRSLLSLGLKAIIEPIDYAENVEEARQKEVEWIGKTPNLINSTTGGETSKTYRSDVKLKMSANRKGKLLGEDNPMFGVKRDDLRQRNLTNNPGKGKEKIIGDKLREMYKTEKYIKIHRRSQATRKAINQVSFDGVIIATYESLREAGLSGFGRKEIVRCCNGLHKQHKGFKWSFAV